MRVLILARRDSPVTVTGLAYRSVGHFMSKTAARIREALHAEQRRRWASRCAEGLAGKLARDIYH